MDDVVNIAQLRVVQGFPDRMVVVEIRRLADSDERCPGLVELRCMHHTEGWTTGRETYLWLTDRGEMVANANKEMEDGLRPPRAGARKTGRRVVYIGRRFEGWQEGRETAAFEFKSYAGFFVINEDNGIVPGLRAWCLREVQG